MLTTVTTSVSDYDALTCCSGILLLNQPFLICFDDICTSWNLSADQQPDVYQLVCLLFCILHIFTILQQRYSPSRVAADIPIYGSAGTLCCVTLCVKSKMIAISSTANCILSALCVHSDFTLIQEIAATDQSYCLEGTRKLNWSDTASYLTLSCGFGWTQIFVSWMFDGDSEWKQQ